MEIFAHLKPQKKYEIGDLIYRFTDLDIKQVEIGLIEDVFYTQEKFLWIFKTNIKNYKINFNSYYDIYREDILLKSQDSFFSWVNIKPLLEKYK